MTFICRWATPNHDGVVVIGEGLNGEFTLPEAFIILGTRAVADMQINGEATVNHNRPLAWPLHLIRPGGKRTRMSPPSTPMSIP